jgi:hypothetical protein
MSTNLPRKSQTLTFILSASLLLLALFPVHLAASTLTLAWNSNAEDDLAGYKVYCGTRSRNYDHVVDVGTVTYCTLSGLEPETRYYFALTAYDTSRNESDYSWEVSAVTGDDPDPAPAPSTSTPLIDTGDSGGCFIATAAYGSYLNPHVKILREFRDEFLTPSSLGRKFVYLYYQYGPSIAKPIREFDLLRSLTRQALLPWIGMGLLSLKTAASRELLLLPLFLLSIVMIAPRSSLPQTR